MQLGITLPQSGEDVSPAGIAYVAREAEAIGLDSVWVLDRLLRPTRPISRGPGAPEETLPPAYGSVYDPIETLAYAAALTERVTLGTSVINALFQPPVVLGRRLATLDRLSGGRVLAGLGQGWMADEFEVSGVPMSRRGAGMEEYVGALRAVWGADPVHLDGRFYRIPESDIGPKPAQEGGIPILIGCYAPAAIERAGRIADGLNPYALPPTLELLAGHVRTFRASASAAGRDADSLSVVVRADGRLTEGPLPEGDRPLFAGTIGQWAGDLSHVAELGVGHVFFSIDGPVEAQLRALTELRHRAV